MPFRSGRAERGTDDGARRRVVAWTSYGSDGQSHLRPLPLGAAAHVGLTWPFVICRGALCVFLVSAVALGRLT